jgi:hypothetical protein
VTFDRGDTVCLTERAMAPRLRNGICTREELEHLTVVATKTTDAGVVLKLRTRDHASIGWLFEREVMLVKRGEG